ncbi:hypothetical protein BV25DRAFT_1841440 [Artomyces pyxidatus]|uniref:Uncharacterized protein n=1 Tax=Artomyces pyxidatus TaxID=48021 RepID=A0ACB8SNC2_9AGAM|nr:hypothetical protein BV25DRAFT_1841440 [Artomyces pyxidatus]
MATWGQNTNMNQPGCEVVMTKHIPSHTPQHLFVGDIILCLDNTRLQHPEESQRGSVYPHWCAPARKAMNTVVSFCTEAITGGLLQMNYVNYEGKIVEEFSVELQGWPCDGKVTAPRDLDLPNLDALRDALSEGKCRWVILTPNAVKARARANQQQAVAGEAVYVARSAPKKTKKAKKAKQPARGGPMQANGPVLDGLMQMDKLDAGVAAGTASPTFKATPALNWVNTSLGGPISPRPSSPSVSEPPSASGWLAPDGTCSPTGVLRALGGGGGGSSSSGLLSRLLNGDDGDSGVFGTSSFSTYGGAGLQALSEARSPSFNPGWMAADFEEYATSTPSTYSDNTSEYIGGSVGLGRDLTNQPSTLGVTNFTWPSSMGAHLPAPY